MKNIKILLASFAFLSLASCSDDFLEKDTTERVSSDKIDEIAITDPSALDALLNGIYNTMIKDGMGGTTRDDDFGQKGIDIYTDMLCSDMALGNTTYKWYETTARYQSTMDKTVSENYIPWRYYYRIVLAANKVIESIDASNADSAGKAVLGQAKALRAYAYFYLSQLYQNGYNPNEEILPIYTDTKGIAKPKSKASEVYALMIADLESAVNLLDGFNRKNKSQIDKAVAQGLLAYVYGAQGNYAKVEEITNDVIATSGFVKTTESQLAGIVVNDVLTNKEAGFNNVNTPSWMWGTDLTVNSGISLRSWWGQVDIYSYSYASAGDTKIIDKDLYDAIPSTDVRKNQFNVEDYTPWRKFFDPNFVISGQDPMTTDYIFMRFDEMILLNIEAKAKLGKDAEAKATLKSFLDNRDTDLAYIDALSGIALQNEIYKQTRIEFWGEGKSYLAMKRNKATITRGGNHLFYKGESFSYDDPRLSFKIPMQEILDNPFID